MRLSFAFIVFVVAANAFAAEPPAKLPVPGEAAQQEVSALIKDVYKVDYEKAKTPAQKVELAKKLLQVGWATKDDAVGRYVLYRIARDISAQQGDLVTAFTAIGHLHSEFKVEPLAMKLEAASVAVKAFKQPKEHLACATLLLPLIDEAVAADRYDHAKSLASLALGSAREGRDGVLVKQVVAKGKEIDEIAAEFAKVRESAAILQEKPSDPEANLAVGRFRCLRKGDWAGGVAMLALGSDEALKSLAVLELAEKPDAMKLGDEWWAFAETQSPDVKEQVQTRAAYWYRKAHPMLSGLAKAKVEGRLAGVARVPAVSTPEKPFRPVGKPAAPRLTEIQYALGDGKWRRHPVSYEKGVAYVTRGDGSRTLLVERSGVLTWEISGGGQLTIDIAMKKTSFGAAVKFIFEE